MEVAIMFLTVLFQNASFTLVSRARNSKSLFYHLVAAVFSNLLWLVVIRQVVLNLNNGPVMVAYLVASVAGSVLMHWLAMRFFEKAKPGELLAGFPTHSKDITGTRICLYDVLDYNFEGDDPCLNIVVFEDNAFRKMYPHWDPTLTKPLLDKYEVETLRMKIVRKAGPGDTLESVLMFIADYNDKEIDDLEKQVDEMRKNFKQSPQ